MSSAYAGAPSAPSSVQVDHTSIDGKNIPLTWSQAPSISAAVDHYVLQGAIELTATNGDGHYSDWVTLIENVPAGGSYTLDTSAESDGSYYRLRLIAVNDSGTSGPSNFIHAGGIPNEPKDYSTAVTFLEGRHFADMQDYGAVNTFGANSNFGEVTKFAAAQNFIAAQNFDKYQYFDDGTDFTAAAQTFATGTSFGSGTTFKTGGSQSLVAGTIPSFGVMLDSFTCDTDSCLPSDSSKFLAPGDLLVSGIDPVATYAKVKPTDKNLTIDGLGLTMTFETVSTAGTIKTDLYDPAQIPSSTLGEGGKVSMMTNSGTVETIGSIIDLTPEQSKVGGTAASTSGNITITLPYKEANIPAGTEESQLTMLHYVNGEWQTEDSCTVDTTNNKITCVVTSLSPFGIGGPGVSSNGGGGNTNCDPNGFGNNNSLRVYQVMYDVDTHEVQVQAYSTCGSISAKMTTPMNQSILGLSTEQTLLDDRIAVYSGYLDESEEKFNISIQNKRDSFDQTFYIQDKSIIKKYTGETGYTSEQKGNLLPTITSTQTTIASEPSVTAVSVTAVSVTAVSQTIEELIPLEKQIIAEKSVIKQTQSMQYTPEPIAEETTESTCGIGTESVNGICKIIIPDEPQSCFLFWCW